LIAELMTPLPADGIFAVDALLVKPGAYIRDPVLWQWQDDKGNWHTYGFNDCRCGNNQIVGEFSPIGRYFIIGF
jgi:E3 ubiquitin-protein ligase TRIP12